MNLLTWLISPNQNQEEESLTYEFELVLFQDIFGLMSEHIKLAFIYYSINYLIIILRLWPAIIYINWFYFYLI